MKVLLLSIPGVDENDGNLFPLGIGYLTSAIKVRHEVKACHYPSMKQARTEIGPLFKNFAPDVVGVSCNTFNRGFVRELIHSIRQFGHNVIIVVGGVHASFCPDQILNDYDADVVVIGEGEITFSALCDALEDMAPLQGVRGIAYKHESKLVVNKPADVVLNLDDLPIPDYSYAQSCIERAEMGFIITSRGCPVRCSFCSTSSFWGQNVRMNSPERVVDEMEILISRFKVRKIFFLDDTFNLGISRVMAICNEIVNRGIKVEWACSCRVTPVSEEMVAAMVNAGCRHICWGIESGSVSMLDKIDKKISLLQVRNAYEISRKFSDVMSTGAYTMVGNPGETEETIKETVDFLNTIPITDCPSTSILYILPGTLLYEKLKKEGQIKDKDWCSHDTVPFYTLENSYLKLFKWAGMVRNSGNRIHFDHGKHFWNKVINTTVNKSFIYHIAWISGLFIKLLDPTKFASFVRKLFPSGKIRF